MLQQPSSEMSTTSFGPVCIIQGHKRAARFFDQCLNGPRSILRFIDKSLYAGMGIRCIRDKQRHLLLPVLMAFQRAFWTRNFPTARLHMVDFAKSVPIYYVTPWHVLCRHIRAGNLSARPRKYRHGRAIIFRSGGVVRWHIGWRPLS